MNVMAQKYNLVQQNISQLQFDSGIMQVNIKDNANKILVVQTKQVMLKNLIKKDEKKTSLKRLFQVTSTTNKETHITLIRTAKILNRKLNTERRESKMF